MSDIIPSDAIQKIKNLYQSDERAQKLFDSMTQRQRDARGGYITVEQIAQLGMSEREARDLARQLEDAGCGRLRKKSSKGPARLELTYNCISLGHAAAGSCVHEETEELEKQSNEKGKTTNVSTDLSEEESSEVSNLTIPQAKMVLASSLGIKMSNIEILVRV